MPALETTQPINAASARPRRLVPLAAYALAAIVVLAYLSTSLWTTAIRVGQFRAGGETYVRLLLLTHEGPGYIVIAIERPRAVLTWGQGRRGWANLSRQLEDGSTLNWRRLGVRHSSDDDQSPIDTPRTMTVVNWMYVLLPAGLMAWGAWHWARPRRL